MRKFILITLLAVLTLNTSFGAVRVNKVPKGEIKQYRLEPDPSEYSTLGHGSTKITINSWYINFHFKL